MSIRRILTWMLVGAVLSLTILTGCALALDAGYLHQALIAWLAADTGRRIEVAGHFQAHVLSSHPHFVAEQVTIGNPTWMPPGTTARIDRIMLGLAIPGDGHLLRVDRLVLEGATLSLVRSVDGNANWQLSNKPGGDALPLIRRLSMPQAHATLSDARRHLNFDGIVSVEDLNDRDGSPQLQILGNGQLNHSEVEFQTLSDPLASASRQQPYHFSFTERSPSSRLSGHGALAHAFDFDHLETGFEASGENLEDLHALTGVSLVNTGKYHLSGTLQRRDAVTDFRDLNATSGDSDMSGSISVDSSGERPKLTGELHSKVLRLADVGEQAARHESTSQQPRTFLLSDAALKPDAVRHGEAEVRFQIQRVETSRVPLRQVAGTLSIDHGTLTVSPLAGQVLDGQFNGRWRLDASSDNPSDTLELHFNHLQIGELDHLAKAGPRYDGLLNAEVTITGHGSSAHQIGSSASGHIAIKLLSGTLRAALAEVSGADLRGLGLMLARSHEQAAIRCGAASFEAHDGTLNTNDLLIDTDDVRIGGQGSVQLDSESLHLELRGHPKETRLLRIKSSVLLGGTLLHPHFGLESPKSLQLIDRGSDQVVDCQALLAR
jgi:uncharacterized protein involved in outer membrane biogenesis